MNKNTISKWFSMFLLMMVAGITGATAQSLTVADFSLEQGQMTEVNIKLAAPADQTIYGVQTDITLSEGLILEEVAAVNAELQFDKNIVAGGATRVALLSLAGASIPAGDVIKLHVKAADTFAGGTIALTNSKLTTSTAGAETSVEDATATVNMSPRKIEKKIAMTGEITSLEALAGAKFMLQNEAGLVLYTPDGWDVKVAKPVTATSNKGNGGFFTLVALDGDHAGQYQVPIWNLDGSRRKFWAGEQYLNAQPGGNVIFGLDGTAPNYGQDGTNLALWTITYEANKGFAFHCVGRDIYLGNDNTAARPSETVVYWKAYTGYDALYDEADLLAAYAMDAPLVKLTEAATALSTAKTAYETDNDIEKFGDALNAAIDVVKTCMALNETYAHLDVTGAAVAAEVLAKYNAGEYANIAELRAAYILAAKAQSTPGANMTLAIVNPSFEFGTIEGWTSKDGGDVANNYNFAQRTGDKFCERWTGAPGKLSDGSFLQVIKGLPYGKYKLTAELQNREQGNGDAAGKGLFLVANEGKTECVAKDGTTFEVVGTTKRGGVLEIGIKLEGCTGNWICFDNFQLTFLEAVAAPAETTATFNFAAEGFREKVGTSLTDVDGIVYNETFTADGATLQVTSGSAASKLYVDTNRGQNLVTYPQYATLTFKAPEGKAIVQIDFTAAGNSNINKLTPSSGAVEGMVWTGNAEGVRFTQGATSYLANAVLTLVDKTDETAALPAIEYTECANIAAFNALAAGTYAKITLTNAEVIGKSADGYSTVWMQDATGGCWIQYTSLNDKLAEKTKVNGTVYAVLRALNGNAQMKEAEATLQSTLEAADIESYTAVAGTIADVNVAANLNKVVKIAADSLVMTSASAGKLYVGETSIDVNNGTATANQQLCKIADWEIDKVLRNITIEAILVAKSTTANQLLPISIVETTTPEPPVVPTITATLEHTATSYCEGDADVYTSNVDAETEHVNNNKFNSTWQGAAYAEFSFAELPANATITEAILTFKGIGESRNARNTDVMLVNAGETLDYTALAAGNAKVNLAAANIQSVSFPKASSQVFTINATEQLNALVAGGQRYAIFKFTNNPGGGDIAGKTSEDAPTLVITYALGAPAIANASFDANAADVITVTTQGYQRNIPEGSDQITGLQPVTGWTPGTQTESDPGYVAGVFAYGSQNLLNNKVAAPATAPEGSTSPSALGLSAVWGGIAQYTQEVTAPAGDYKLSYTVYNGANTGAVTKNLFGFIANNGTEYLSDVKTFTVGEWATYDVTFTLDEETTGKISVGFIGSGGSGNAPHLFLDNVKLEKVPGIEVALKELEKAIAAAQEKAGSYTIGEGLFTYAASEIEPLNTAITTAQTAYRTAESKAAVEAAIDSLNAFVGRFAPVATTPAADKAYTFQLRLGGETPLYMALAEGGITIAEEATPLKFIAVEGAEGQYNLSDEAGTLFVGLAGGDAWTMSTLADQKAAWTFTALPDGAYRINNLVTAGRFVGTNAADKEAGKPCYADKRTDNGNVDWLIAEYVAPPVDSALIAAKAALQAIINADKTIVTEGQQGAEELANAITTAEAAAEAAATVEDVAAARAALAKAVSVFVKANTGRGFAEIAQNQGKDLDTFTRTELVEGEDYNTYTAAGDLNIAIKMVDLDVAGCDYVTVKFAEPVAAGWHLAFWSNQDLVDVPAGATEFKYVFADDPKCGVSAEGVLPQICMMTFFGGFQAPLEAKIVGIYKHMNAIPELAQTLNVERYAGLGYTAQEATVDFTEAKAYLGVEEVTTEMLRVVNPDGTLINDYAPYDGWFNGEGAAETWGANTKINVKFFEAIPNGTYTICDMNGADSIGATYTVKWALVANDKQVTYTINVKFVEKPVIDLKFADLSVKETKTVTLTSELGKSYEGLTADVDVAAILAKLEVTSLDDLTIYAVQSDGSLDDNYKLGTTDGWRDSAGNWQTWGDAAYFYVKADFSKESAQIYDAGGMDGKNTIASWNNPFTYTATYAFVKTGSNDAVVLDVTLRYTVPTGINAIARDAQKNVIFNLNGQKVNKAQKGLFIINGKKVVNK